MFFWNYFLKLNKSLCSPIVRSEFKIDNFFKGLILNYLPECKNVMELGGSSRPLLKKSKDFHYCGVDIDDSFDTSIYYDEFIQMSVENQIEIESDLIFSKYLMEHVEDNKKAYLSQIKSLNNNGRIIHLYPLGYHPFSLVSKIFSNRSIKRLIRFTRPDSASTTGYPSYYDLGNPYELERFIASIDEPIEARFTYHYGASDYFSFFFPFCLVIHVFNLFNKFLNNKIFASNVIVEIKRLS